MNRNHSIRKYTILLTLLIGVAGAAVAVEQRSHPNAVSRPPVIDTECVGECATPVATVNGVAIPKTELVLTERVLAREAGTSTPAEIEEKALHQVVTNEVLVQRASGEGWNMSDSEIKGYIASVVATARAEASTTLPLQMLEDAAHELGITVDQLPENPSALNLYRRQFQIAFMRQRIAAALPIADRSNRAALDQAVDEYVRNSGAAVRRVDR